MPRPSAIQNWTCPILKLLQKLLTMRAFLLLWITNYDDCKKDAPSSALSCTVNAFELPQDVKLADSDLPWIINRALEAVDLGRAWLGFTGDPKYLVYYEKFPEEAAAWWTYGEEDSTGALP